MFSLPVLAFLFYDLFIFLGGLSSFQKSSRQSEGLLLSALFFCSGMPALIYQVVWERVLFSIYGVNAESVAVIVSAFMLGLGLGSLVGGQLSTRFSRYGVLLFIAASPDDFNGSHPASPCGRNGQPLRQGGRLRFASVLCQYVRLGGCL